LEGLSPYLKVDVYFSILKVLSLLKGLLTGQPLKILKVQFQNSLKMLIIYET